jgi:hypothetical protein
MLQNIIIAASSPDGKPLRVVGASYREGTLYLDLLRLDSSPSVAESLLRRLDLLVLDRSWIPGSVTKVVARDARTGAELLLSADK